MTFTYIEDSDCYTMEFAFLIDEETQKILDVWYKEGDCLDNNSVNIMLRQFVNAMPWCNHAKDLTIGFDEIKSQFRVELGVTKESLQHPSDIVHSFCTWFMRRLREYRDGPTRKEGA